MSTFALQERDPRLVVDVVPSLPLPLLTMDMLPLDSHLPETERFTVELKKDVHGLGITIAGYVCEKGMYIKSFLISGTKHFGLLKPFTRE